MRYLASCLWACPFHYVIKIARVCEIHVIIRCIFEVQLNFMITKTDKYKLLSLLPGSIGQRYRYKLLRVEKTRNHEFTQAEFISALADSSGMVCVDIGANVGYYTRIMAQHAATVYAFEPDPLAFSILKQTTAELENVVLIEAAAGASNDNVALYRSRAFKTDPRRQTEASSTFAARHTDIGNSVEVTQLDIVQFLQSIGTEVGVIKIDAEGAEVPLLESILDNGALMSRIHYIFVETHEDFFPTLSKRFDAIRARVKHIDSPKINLSWN